MNAARISLQILVCCAISGCCSLSDSFSKGRADAHADIQRGHLMVETGGMRAPWDDTYTVLMKKRYGVELRPVGTCMISDDTAEHCRAYNEVMIAEISRRYGADVFDRTEAEAKALTPNKSR